MGRALGPKEHRRDTLAKAEAKARVPIQSKLGKEMINGTGNQLPSLGALMSYVAYVKKIKMMTCTSKTSATMSLRFNQLMRH